MEKSRDGIKNCDKKDAIQSNNESIQLYEDEQKSLQEKLQKVERKRTGFGHEMEKRRGDSKGTVVNGWN